MIKSNFFLLRNGRFQKNFHELLPKLMLRVSKNVPPSFPLPSTRLKFFQRGKARTKGKIARYKKKQIRRVADRLRNFFHDHTARCWRKRQLALPTPGVSLSPLTGSEKKEWLRRRGEDDGSPPPPPADEREGLLNRNYWVRSGTWRNYSVGGKKVGYRFTLPPTGQRRYYECTFGVKRKR